MKDIKKRFIDILFEPEDEEEEDLFEEKSGKQDKKTVKEAQPINAKDILYRKSDQSAFIDLEETINSVKNIRKETEEYELSSQISPIFGVIREGSQTVKHEVDTNEALVNKPEDSHLDIITSPIYGYGSKEDIEDELQNEDDYQFIDRELHELFDRPAEERDAHYVSPVQEEDDDEYLDYRMRRDEDEDDITLFDIYGEDK